MRHWDDPLLTEIHEVLYRLGVRATIQGFLETSAAVYLVMRRRDRSRFSIMEVYRKIAELYHTDLDAIDPRIRRVIRIAWKSNPEALSRMAGRPLEAVPTPRQFIDILGRHLIFRRLW